MCLSASCHVLPELFGAVGSLKGQQHIDEVRAHLCCVFHVVCEGKRGLVNSSLHGSLKQQIKKQVYLELPLLEAQQCGKQK